MGIRTYEKQEKSAYIEDYRNSGESLARYDLEKVIPETNLIKKQAQNTCFYLTNLVK